MKSSTAPIIQGFLEEPRFAFIGVSRDPKHFSRSLYAEFLKHEYTPVPVNARAEEIEGVPCFADVRNIQPAVNTALILTPPDQVFPAVRACREAGISTVWLYGIAGPKGLDPAVLGYCREQGIRVVDGYCPFMFLPRSPFFHKLHGFALRVTGRYPA